MNIGLSTAKQMSNEYENRCEKCNLYQVICIRYVDNIKQRLCNACLNVEKFKYKYDSTRYDKSNLL
jgi:hypothetical protein